MIRRWSGSQSDKSSKQISLQLEICSHLLATGHNPGASRVALVMGKAQKVLAAVTGLQSKMLRLP